MKKKGFTLAETLLTLGIIGVIAAMTLPSLNNNAKNAQTTAKLAKAVSEFEQANMALLSDEDVDSLTAAYDNIVSEEYFNALSRFMKIEIVGDVDGSDGDIAITADALNNRVEEQHLSAKNGIDYTIIGDRRGGIDVSAPASRQYVSNLIIDVDGVNNGSNRFGVDRFGFALYNDGSLKAIGSRGWDGTHNNNNQSPWVTPCPVNGTINNQDDAIFCTGSIFENGLRIRYRVR